MAIVQVSVLPVGTEGSSISRFVAGAITVLQDSGLDYRLTDMGTIIYGELDEILRVVKRMHESCFGGKVTRVLTQIVVDDRRDRMVGPDEKVQSVLSKLG